MHTTTHGNVYIFHYNLKMYHCLTFDTVSTPRWSEILDPYEYNRLRQKIRCTHHGSVPLKFEQYRNGETSREEKKAQVNEELAFSSLPGQRTRKFKANLL